MKRLSKRTSEEAKKEYERQWLDALSFIQREKVSGNENIIQILEHYDKQSVRRFFSSKFFHDIHKRLGLSLKRKQPPTERLAVLDGAYIIAPIDLTFNNYLIDILAKFLFKMGDQIDCVVELGSGIGRKLIALAHQLDPELRKRLMFYACEFTTAGREACAALQELNSDIRISIEPFDYYQPDFSFLPENKNVLCFTSHSIEQIPILNRRVFEEIIAMTDRCYCYHAEPVGWQYLEDLRGQREQMRAKALRRQQSFFKRKLKKADRKVFSKLGVGFMDASQRFEVDVDKGDIGRSDKVSVNAAKWSSAKDYNTNLVPLLKDMEREGLISIDAEEVNLFGENPFNPTTIISWHKV